MEFKKKILPLAIIAFFAFSTSALFINCSSSGGGGAASGGAGSSDWYYHFDCNGDPSCLSTNFAGSTYGDSSDLGPDYPSCSSLLNFATINWNVPPATSWCDHSPTGSVGGGGTGGLNAPTFTSMSATSGAPNVTFLGIYGTNFPSSTSLVTASYCGKALQVTYAASGQVTVKIPFMASCKSPITLTTAAGSVNTTPFTVLNKFRSVAASGSMIVVVGDWGTVMTSTNGTTWTPRPSGVSLTINSNLNVVNWNGSQFMVGGDSFYNLRSTDGTTWAELHHGGFSGFQSLIWDGTQYVAGLSATGYIETSQDGGTWTSHNPISDVYYGLAYSGSAYVAATQSDVYSSSDAVTWTQRFSAAGIYRKAVAWGGSEFRVVGSSGVTDVSSDGVTWLNSSTGQSFDLNGIAYGSAKFVAVGNSGTILTYTGAGGWIGRSSGTSEHLLGVTWSGSMFIAVGANNTIVTSPDGITWTVRAAF